MCCSCSRRYNVSFMQVMAAHVPRKAFTGRPFISASKRISEALDRRWRFPGLRQCDRRETFLGNHCASAFGTLSLAKSKFFTRSLALLAVLYSWSLGGAELLRATVVPLRSG